MCNLCENWNSGVGAKKWWLNELSKEMVIKWVVNKMVIKWWYINLGKPLIYILNEMCGEYLIITAWCIGER